MSAGQLAIVWALFAFATMGVPGFWLGWYAGRRCLRADLARELGPVVQEVRVFVTPQPSPLALAGRLPAAPDPFDTEPLLLWSQQAAAIDAHEREITAMIDEAERRSPYGRRHRQQ
jgi:hypothetical protein